MFRLPLIVLQILLSFIAISNSQTSPQCNPTNKEVTDEISNQFQACVDQYAGTQNTTSTPCWNLCYWKGLGFFFGNGSIAEERINQISRQMYDDQDVIKARAYYFTECQKLHKTNVNEEDVLKDSCAKFKNFHDCVITKREEPCKETSSKIEDIFMSYKMLTCRPGFNKPDKRILSHSKSCREEYTRSQNSSSATCFRMCIWTKLNYFSADGILNETRVNEVSNLLYSNPESAKAKSADFFGCEKQFQTHLNESDVTDNRCSKFRPFHDCVMNEMEKPCLLKKKAI